MGGDAMPRFPGVRTAGAIHALRPPDPALKELKARAAADQSA
jgi:hypothetical protein